MRLGKYAYTFDLTVKENNSQYTEESKDSNVDGVSKGDKGENKKLGDYEIKLFEIHLEQ